MKKKFTLTLFFVLGSFLAYQQNAESQNVVVLSPAGFDVSMPLRDMKPVKKHFWDRFKKDNEEKEIPNRFKHIPPSTTRIFDNALQVNYPASGTNAPNVSNTIINVDGTSNSSNTGRLTPPDPNGDVGLNHYVQTVNCMLQIFNKSGTSVYGPVTTSTLWNGFTGPWSGHNDGDAVVLYDEQADRWIIAQFAIYIGSYPNYTNYQLVAVSTTGDPTGSYYRYAFQFDYMPDYPKMGVWQDGYYMAVNRFNINSSTTPFIGVGACVLDRTKMLAGDASATMQYFKTETLGGSGSASGPYCYSMLPSDCDGTWAPSGAPNYFTYISDNVDGPSNELRIWSLHADWTTTTNSTFTFVTSLPVTAYTMLGTGTGVVPQQGTTQKLDGLGDRLMYRNQYRNFSSYETFLTCHSVSVNSVSGVRWYEYRKTGSTWSVYQQSTYAPTDSKWRWLGSIGMNQNGDIGMAFTASGSSMYPSIYFTGRRATDALNTMTQTEGIIVTGTTSMTTSSQYTYRWGDYAAMSIDPSDNQTFWTTNEYVGTYGGSWPWATKIASFKWSNQPTVVTTAATSITGTGATLNGTINPNGLSSTYHFEWGTTAAYGNNTSTNSAGSGSTAVTESVPISGLTGGTTYHFRIDGTNSDGTSNGNDMTFTPGAATLTTTAATNITTTTATSGGNVIGDGGSTVTARGVCWSTSANPTISGSHTTDGAGTGTFVSSLTGLTANTAYHIRAYATNSFGTWYGNDLQFTTLCAYYSLPFTESFSNTSIPSCWSQVDHQSNGEVWLFGVITGYTGLPALTGNYAYLCSRCYGTGQSQNADLVTPVLDCSSYNTVTLAFNHYFRQGGTATATLSYSIDGGTNWTTIQSWTTSTANPAAFSQTIAGVANQAQVKFRWNYTGTYGYWWAVDDVSVTGTTTNTLAVTPPNQNVPATPAGSTTFTVTSNTSWNAASNQTWCTVTPSGTGNGTITANYTINTSATSRVATITVTASGAPTVTVTVTQAGATPTLSVTPANQNVPSTPAGTTNFTVTSNADWTAVSNQTWCTVTPSGTGNGTIIASYAINPTTVSRIASITVTVATLTPVVVTVTQAAGAPTLTVVPPNQNVPNTPAGSTTFTVSSNTSWTTSSNASWCNVSPGSSSGDGVITASYTENTDTISRTATITVTASGLSPVTVTVTQAASPHTLSVLPSNQNVPASPAGSTQFSVTSNSNWTVVSDQAWCTVNPSGSANGIITANYTVNNTSGGRIANITVTVAGISPVIVTVTQNGPSPTLSVTPANQNVGYLPGTTNFTVLSNSAWTASSDSSWLAVTPAGTGNGTINANFLQNPYYITRVATVTVSVAGLTPQAVTVTQAQSTVSVREHSGDVIRVIPNPSKGTFRLDVGEMKFTSINVSIMDISGRIIMQRECKDHADLLFNLSGSPEGSYFIRIIADSQEVTEKLILAH